jgi:hypothetical protein
MSYNDGGPSYSSKIDTKSLVCHHNAITTFDLVAWCPLANAIVSSRCLHNLGSLLLQLERCHLPAPSNTIAHFGYSFKVTCLFRSGPIRYNSRLECMQQILQRIPMNCHDEHPFRTADIPIVQIFSCCKIEMPNFPNICLKQIGW